MRPSLILIILFLNSFFIFSQDSSSKIREIIVSKIIDDPHTVFFDDIEILRQISILNNDDLRIIKNTSFARHGYEFKSKDLQEYFKTKEWYKATKDDIVLTGIDSSNISFLKIISNKKTDVVDLLHNFYEDYYLSIGSENKSSKKFTDITLIDSANYGRYDGFDNIRLYDVFNIKKIIKTFGNSIWEYKKSEYNSEYLTANIKTFIFKDVILFAEEYAEGYQPNIIYSRSTIQKTNLGLRAGINITNLKKKYHLNITENENYILKFDQVCIKPTLIIENGIVKSLLFVSCAG
jgi:hypothetical protein